MQQIREGVTEPEGGTAAISGTVQHDSWRWRLFVVPWDVRECSAVLAAQACAAFTTRQPALVATCSLCAIFKPAAYHHPALQSAGSVYGCGRVCLEGLKRPAKVGF